MMWSIFDLIGVTRIRRARNLVGCGEQSGTTAGLSIKTILDFLRHVQTCRVLRMYLNACSFENRSSRDFNLLHDPEYYLENDASSLPCGSGMRHTHCFSYYPHTEINSLSHAIYLLGTSKKCRPFRIQLPISITAGKPDLLHLETLQQAATCILSSSPARLLHFNGSNQDTHSILHAKAWFRN